MERRFASECRAAMEGERLIGHASVFNEETRIADFYEEIAPSAFDDVLDGDTVLQLDHTGLPLARTTAKPVPTMKLATDRRGLVVDADPAPTTAGNDLRILVARGDMYSMSFGFTVAEDEWTKRADGAHKRIIHKVGRLYDVSVVTFPAYLGTDVSMRSLFGEIPTPPPSRFPVPPPLRIQTLHIRHQLHMKGRQA